VDPRSVFEPPTPIRSWRFIVLHHSATPAGGLASIDRSHREVRGWDECGYHFVIGNGSESGDGEIEVGGRWLKQKHGAHTRVESNPGSNLYNEEGIGVCLIGDFDVAPPTPKQVDSCRRLVAYLQERCRVPAQGITTHGDLDNTECPGQYFPRAQIIPNGGFAARR
jgi:N-acetyl-anhydromuramyl-L-alanine amidase AmpD